MELYKTKVKKCGDIIRIHKYEKVVTRGYKSKRVVGKSSNSNVSEEEREKRRIKKLYKSRSDFIDIINYNFTKKDILITLTHEGEEDPDMLKYKFNNFIKKIKYRFGNDIKYCYVKYKQDRGIYHYHVILNISFIDKDVLDKIWPYGRSQVSRIKNVNAIATYMAHHINKETVAKKDYKSKVFQKSRTCEIPKWTYGKDAENILYTISSDYKEKFNKRYDTEMYGEMNIILYEK